MIEGKTWCATEIPDYSNANHIPPIHFACHWPEPPAIVSQHVLPQRRFVMLSPKVNYFSEYSISERERKRESLRICLTVILQREK